MNYTYSLTAAQRSALQLAVCAAQLAWQHRATILRDFAPTIATDIDQRVRALEEIHTMLYRPQDSQEPARCDCAGQGAVAEAASNGTALAVEVMPTSSAGGRSIDPFDDDKYSYLRDEALAEGRLYVESDESFHGVGRAFL